MLMMEITDDSIKIADYVCQIYIYFVYQETLEKK